MGGVFGTTRGDLWQASIPSVLALLGHRGPDATWAWTTSDGAVALAHTSLSMVGPSRPQQPTRSDDGVLTISHDGQIYNSSDLAPASTAGPGASDARIFGEALRRDGPAGLDGIRGMYAAAAWDEDSRTLSAVRDPWGIKPLYVLRHPSGGVTVSSEIPVLLESADAREIDPITLAHYLVHGHTGSTATMFRHITKIAPGTARAWQRDGQRWVERTHRIGRCSTTVTAGGFSDVIAEAVRACLVANIDVGVLLGGGPSSTLLAAVARDFAPGTRAFTWAFPDHPGIDESPSAMANARALGVQCDSVPVTSADMEAAADVVLNVHGEPLGDATVLPLTCLSAAAGAEVKAVLVGGSPGDGSVRRGRAPRSGEASAAGDAGWAMAAGLPWAGDAARMAGAERLARAGRGHVDVYLEGTDRATMAWSLEARMPYLDPAMVAMSQNTGTPPEALIRQELVRRLPSFRSPYPHKPPKVALAPVLAGALGDAGRYQLSSQRSILARMAGGAWQSPLRERAGRSPSLTFRLAMLGRWEQLFADRIDAG